MKQIPLTQGQFAIVDDEDYTRLASYSWYAAWATNTRSFYAARMGRGGKRQIMVRMHREVLQATHGDGLVIDHRNGDTLDNRRSNLRIASHAQNACNSRRRADCTSGVKGVCPFAGKWRAQITIKGKRTYLGLFESKEAAGRAYARAAGAHHGDFASFDKETA